MECGRYVKERAWFYLSAKGPGRAPHEPEDHRVGYRRLLEGGFVVLLGGHLVGCAEPAAVVNPDISEGEAVLAALEHVAALKWGGGSTLLVEGKLAVAHDGEEPLSESTRGFLDGVFEARGWRWSTGDPLVPTGNCAFPLGDCRLKDPTELHLTFSVRPWPGPEDHAPDTAGSSWLHPWSQFVVEPVSGQEGYKVHVEWLSSFRWRGGDRAELGGEGLLVTRQPEGWSVEVVMNWIT